MASACSACTFLVERKSALCELSRACPARRLWVGVELIGGLAVYILFTAVLEAMFSLSKPVRAWLAAGASTFLCSAISDMAAHAPTDCVGARLAGTVLFAAAMLLLPHRTGGLWPMPAEPAGCSNRDADAEGTALDCFNAADVRDDTAVRAVVYASFASSAALTCSKRTCLCIVSMAGMGGSSWQWMRRAANR